MVIHSVKLHKSPQSTNKFQCVEWRLPWAITMSALEIFVSLNHTPRPSLICVEEKC